MSAVSESKGRVRISVRLSPRASRDEIGEVRNGSLVVRVTAPPAENRANQGLCKLLARRLGLAKGQVAVTGGAKSRDKVVEVEGLDAGEVRSKLGLPG